jgi:hypothetical protein
VPPEVEFSLRWVKLNFNRLVTAIVEQPHQLGAMAPSSWDPVITIMTPSSVLVLPARRSCLVIAVNVLKRQNNCRFSLLYHLLQRCRKSAVVLPTQRQCVCVSHDSHNKQLFLP